MLLRRTKAVMGRRGGLPRRAITLLTLAALACRAVVVDRVAVIVGTHAIKTSDIQRELRVTSLLNLQPLDESAPAMRQAAERLIDQELVRADMVQGQYTMPTEGDAADFLQQIKRERFGGSDTRFAVELARHRLTLDQLRHQLLWQLSVLRFIDQRFRPAVLVTDEDIAAYYQQHRAELQRAYPHNNTLEALTPQLREALTGERINQAFEEWLAQKRKETRIDYRMRAFAGSTQ